MTPLKYKRGEIYLADLPDGIGSEQANTRPVLIIQNNTGNRYSPTVIVALITTQIKNNLPTHVALENCNLVKESLLLAEQIRTLDKSRLLYKIGCLDIQTMAKVDQALKISLGVVRGGTTTACLCPICARRFYRSSSFFIKRQDRFARSRSICQFCGRSLGFDYSIYFR